MTDYTGDVTEDELRARLTDSEHMVHRLRDWTAGDTVYGVETVTGDGAVSTGKTYRDGCEPGGGAEAKARDHYEKPPVPPSGVTFIYRATIANVRTEPRNPADPGEPPLKFAEFRDVEILDWKQSTGGGGDGGE